MAGYAKHEAQDWAWENLNGEWTTLPTPFTPDDEIDEAAIRHNIRYIRSLGTRGAGSSWGMGEFWSPDRRRATQGHRDRRRRGRGRSGPLPPTSLTPPSRKPPVSPRSPSPPATTS